MATGFKRKEVAELLVKCRRRCCICHRFCGTKIETDHIDQAADSQNHSIENAIAVCFDCHAEIHAYNPRHPRGRKFTPEELRNHKKQWLEICETRPEIFLEASRNTDIGPLQGLLDELDHNLVISGEFSGGTMGFLFREEQIERAIREGVLSTVDDTLRQELSKAYGAISRANQLMRSLLTRESTNGQVNQDTVQGAVTKAIQLILEARDSLLGFVKSEDPNANA